MRKMRLVCLLVTLAAISLRPQSAKAETDCCQNFSGWCDGFCYAHGGQVFCQSWVGSGCSDLCLCADNTMYEDHSGLCQACQ
jgi:hypothetical protein